jgi:peroxiredoxin
MRAASFFKNGLVALVLLSSTAPSLSESAFAAQLGSKVPDFRLVDSAGKTHSAMDYSGRIVVIAFWSFKCPVSLVYDERLREVSEKYSGGGVTVVAVDSNSNESGPEVARNAQNRNLPYPILIDEDGALADKLQATLVPSFFVFDAAGVMRYQGPLDNNKKPGDRTRIPYLEQALDDLLSGRPVANPEFPFFGCAIRRRTL